MQHSLQMSSDRSFGLVFFVVFAVYTIYVWFKLNTLLFWSLGVSGAFLLSALICPKILRPLNILWFYFGILIHKVTNPIIMAFIYFLVVTPIGLTLRLFKKDLLQLDIDKSIPSYWIKREGQQAKYGRRKFLKISFDSKGGSFIQALDSLQEIWRFLRVRKKFWPLGYDQRFRSCSIYLHNILGACA